MISRRLVLLGAAALALVASCKDPVEPPFIVTDTFAGTYVLRTINGFPPPQIIEQNGDSVASITAGVVFLNSDSTFVDSTVVEYVIDGVRSDVPEVARGFFRTSGASIFFYPSGGVAYGMTRDDDVLTQNFGGDILVYRK